MLNHQLASCNVVCRIQLVGGTQDQEGNTAQGEAKAVAISLETSTTSGSNDIANSALQNFLADLAMLRKLLAMSLIQKVFKSNGMFIA